MDDLRARLCLRALLPLVETLAEDDPRARALCAGPALRVSLVGGAQSATLEIGDGHARVTNGQARGPAPGYAPRPAPGYARGSGRRGDLNLDFGSARALADAFVGRLATPSLRALSRPLALARVVRLLARLRLLEPRDEVPAGEQRTYARVLLRFLTRGVAEMARPGGDAEAMRVASRSPNRVFQWRIAGTEDGAWLRMSSGRVGSGAGVHPSRPPFVDTVFPSVAAACRVLGGATSRMDSVVGGDVETFGSPEYARKVSVLAQRLDGILRGSR